MIKFLEDLENKLNLIREKISKGQELEREDFLCLLMASMMEENVQK